MTPLSPCLGTSTAVELSISHFELWEGEQITVLGWYYDWGGWINGELWGGKLWESYSKTKVASYSKTKVADGELR